jgi:hypothetical protein
MYPKEIFEFCELVQWRGVKKCQNLTFQVNFLRQKLWELFLFILQGSHQVVVRQ